ncbi:2-succinyl-5-enolpyruvyl-6-hydroxy-3-cyclohexene-1-carboxylate synthase, partial [Arthrobacter sp. STN4]|nr:2-succinyl-5-enolpyruvyl-6-hydroxy-3-cyclohexene-1-carboxylate synthase [Arthrobacter sp. STN4]
YFGTPHGVDLCALAVAYGWRYVRAGTVAGLGAALAVPVRGRSIVEVVATRDGLRELHARVHAALSV